MRTMGIGDRARICSTNPMTPLSVTPFSRARWLARWIVVPSASGSEKGTPSSRRSAPASPKAHASSRVVDKSGSPAVMKGIKALPRAARRSRKHRSIRFMLQRPMSDVQRQGSRRSRTRSRIPPCPGAPPHDLRNEVDVLVPAAGKIDQKDTIPSDFGRHPGRIGNGVRALQGRDDALEDGEEPEALQGLLIRHPDVCRTADLHEVRVLGSDAGIIEPCRHRVRGLNLAVAVLQDVAQRPVKHPRLPSRKASRVFARFDPEPPGLDADHPDAGILDEGVKEANGVRPSSHTPQPDGRDPPPPPPRPPPPPGSRTPGGRPSASRIWARASRPITD